MNFNGVRAFVDEDSVTVNGKNYEVDINIPTNRLNSQNYLFLNLRGGYITIVTDSVFKQNLMMEVEEL